MDWAFFRKPANMYLPVHRLLPKANAANTWRPVAMPPAATTGTLTASPLLEELRRENVATPANMRTHLLQYLLMIIASAPQVQTFCQSNGWGKQEALLNPLLSTLPYIYPDYLHLFNYLDIFINYHLCNGIYIRIPINMILTIEWLIRSALCICECAQCSVSIHASGSNRNRRLHWIPLLRIRLLLYWPYHPVLRDILYLKGLLISLIPPLQSAPT